MPAIVVTMLKLYMHRPSEIYIIYIAGMPVIRQLVLSILHMLPIGLRPSYIHICHMDMPHV